jgi:hypothetical protein
MVGPIDWNDQNFPRTPLWLEGFVDQIVLNARELLGGDFPIQILVIVELHVVLDSKVRVPFPEEESAPALKVLLHFGMKEPPILVLLRDNLLVDFRIEGLHAENPFKGHSDDEVAPRSTSPIINGHDGAPCHNHFAQVPAEAFAEQRDSNSAQVDREKGDDEAWDKDELRNCKGKYLKLVYKTEKDVSITLNHFPYNLAPDGAIQLLRSPFNPRLSEKWANTKTLFGI